MKNPFLAQTREIAIVTRQLRERHDGQRGLVGASDFTAATSHSAYNCSRMSAGMISLATSELNTALAQGNRDSAAAAGSRA